jgi:addiction module RelE/StbE family toxin
MKIIWSPLSLDKITDISEYIALDNITAAEKWIDAIFSTVSRLSKFPKSGRIVPEFPERNLREIIFGNYRIIYRIKDNQIQILTIRHGRQMLSEQDIGE